MSESFAELFEESLKRSEMRTGEVITAEVIRVEHNHVVVNAGLKSEAYVPIEEFKNDQGELEVQAGDFVSVAIGSVENGYGDTPEDLCNFLMENWSATGVKHARPEQSGSIA